MAQPLMVRPECFGATVFDPETLAYFFIYRVQLAQLTWRLGYSDRDDPGVAAVGLTDEPSGGAVRRIGGRGGRGHYEDCPSALTARHLGGAGTGLFRADHAL
jgi:hypothetical protein